MRQDRPFFPYGHLFVKRAKFVEHFRSAEHDRGHGLGVREWQTTYVFPESPPKPRFPTSVQPGKSRNSSFHSLSIASILNLSKGLDGQVSIGIDEDQNSSTGVLSAMIAGSRSPKFAELKRANAVLRRELLKQPPGSIRALVVNDNDLRRDLLFPGMVCAVKNCLQRGT